MYDNFFTFSFFFFFRWACAGGTASVVRRWCVRTVSAWACVLRLGSDASVVYVVRARGARVSVRDTPWSHSSYLFFPESSQRGSCRGVAWSLRTWPRSVGRRDPLIYLFSKIQTYINKINLLPSPLSLSSLSLYSVPSYPSFGLLLKCSAAVMSKFFFTLEAWKCCAKLVTCPTLQQNKITKLIF
jgi:hypothetical protein